MKGIKYLMFFCLLLLTVSIGLYSGNVSVGAAENKEQQLPVLGSYENLKRILLEASKTGNIGNGFMDDMVEALPASGEVLRQAVDSDFAASAAKSDNYSQTNVQVKGVDEADTVKTDGEYIYKISGNRLIIIKAYPVEDMEIVSVLDYGSGNYNPVEMYVDENYLVVIGNNYYNIAFSEPVSAGDIRGDSVLIPAPDFENSVKVLVYDLSDKHKLQLIREVEVDGSYISSRKIQDNIYLVNNKYIPYYRILEDDEEPPLPAYRDSAGGGEIQRIGYDQIACFPGSVEPNYMLVAGINLDSMADDKLEVKTYMGAGQNIYSSLDNLYVAVSEYNHDVKPLPDSSADKRRMPLILPRPMEVNTAVYKFALNNGTSDYIVKGSVPGRILNQFSMDEYQGHFRIATTLEKYGSNEVEMSNNLYILDEDMKVTGKIENIAPGEKIYSVRFLGNKGYMVTFKTVDPLFVLDLGNPNKPEILGELKIPGYSNYLHPYDENHIIGFGKEALEIEQSDWSGKGTVKNAYYLGMKIALFDISDVHNPVEKFKIEIGDRGTDSELLWNHKALLFDKEKNLLAFPITVYKTDYTNINKNDYLARLDPRLAYGKPVFEGAYVYNLTLTDGFQLQGTITHHQPGRLEDLQRNRKYDHQRNISRILFIEDNLYTMSDSYLKINDLNTLAEKGVLKLK